MTLAKTSGRLATLPESSVVQSEYDKTAVVFVLVFSTRPPKPRVAVPFSLIAALSGSDPAQLFQGLPASGAMKNAECFCGWPGGGQAVPSPHRSTWTIRGEFGASEARVSGVGIQKCV